MPETLSILSTRSLRTGVRDFVLSLGWTLREEDFITTSRLDQEGAEGLNGNPALLEELRQITLGAGVPPLAIFTSEKGVENEPFYKMRFNAYGQFRLPGCPARWQIACLSGKTLESVVSRFGADQVVYTAKNARELASAIITDGRFKEAIFFCALEHRPELPAALRQAGIRLAEIPVYKTVARPKAIDTIYDGVLFFSPSGVGSFFQLNRLPKGAVCFAIGETTAEAIKEYTGERIIISNTPSQEDLLRCVQFYYDNQNVQE